MIGLRLLAVEEVADVAPEAQAAALRRACGHARGESGLIERGFRFYPMPGGELPSFLNRRVDAGSGRSAAVTLLAGLDPRSGEPTLEDARSTADAAVELDEGRGGIWLIRLTLGNATVSWPELTGSLLRSDPDGFAALAGELLSLPLCLRRACPLCGRR